jgi:hypothetical protein
MAKSLADLNIYTGRDFINAADAGQKARTLADLGQYAARGDYQGAASAAFAGGQPDMGAALAKMSQDQHAQLISDAASGAYAADDPQKWQSFKTQFEQAHPGFVVPPFQAREALIRQAVPVIEQLRMRQDQANADREYQIRAAELARKNTPNLETMYDPATGQEMKATWNSSTGKWEQVGGVKAPTGTSLSVGPDGTIQFNQGPGAKLTEGQSKDVNYATRAAGALPIIDQYGSSLTSLPESVGGAAPVIGNYMKSPEFQQAEQAGNEFLAAILRKDSGAQITPSENENYGRIYLPRPGDSPAVLERKRVSRERALQGIALGLPTQAILSLENAGIALPKRTGQSSGDAASSPAPSDGGGGRRSTIDGYQIEEVP